MARNCRQSPVETDGSPVSSSSPPPLPPAAARSGRQRPRRTGAAAEAARRASGTRSARHSTRPARSRCAGKSPAAGVPGSVNAHAPPSAASASSACARRAIRCAIIFFHSLPHASSFKQPPIPAHRKESQIHRISRLGRLIISLSDIVQNSVYLVVVITYKC